MKEHSIAIVIPVGNDREENLAMVLGSLRQQVSADLISRVVLVKDGGEEADFQSEFKEPPFPVVHWWTPKHEPGREHPRNVGVRVLDVLDDPATHVWFLDSDVILDPEALAKFADALDHDEKRILVGPYDWLPPGVRQPVAQLQNDPRWESFRQYGTEVSRTNDLSAGLACFSGNLIWPKEEFRRVGGFWNELHHGRCEDGELGLRAVAMGVPVGFVAEARGWHLDHPRNIRWIENANARDVPMLNARHPWVQGSGLFVVEEDGKRFDVRCPCGWSGNTALIWDHQATCPERIPVEPLS